MNNPARPVRVLYVATYYVDDYVRQTVILRHLRDMRDVQIETIIVNRRSGWRYVDLLWRVLRHPKKVDVIYLGWRGIEVMPLLRLLTRQPIILDAFLSIYETLCLERRRWSPTSPIGRFVRLYESKELHQAAGIVTDTRADAEYFSKLYSLPEKKFTVVPVGVDRAIYQPQEATKIPGREMVILFYGTYLPLHGAEVIVGAAKMVMMERGIRFVMIGDGPTRAMVEAQAKEAGLKNITFHNRLSQASLANEIAAADICLGGPFSDIPKAKRVITGKTFQFLAMGKPTIVSDTPGNREILTDGVDCLMVPPNNPPALAAAIVRLTKDAPWQARLQAASLQTSRRIDQVITSQIRKALQPYGLPR